MKGKTQKLFLVFVIAFALNLLWENLHSLLYIHYKGGEITEFILLKATLNDAIFITLGGVLMLLFNKKYGVYIVLTLLLILSVCIEVWALQTGRWAYRDIMPIVPIVLTGLTPTIQLALLGYISFKLARI